MHFHLASVHEFRGFLDYRASSHVASITLNSSRKKLGSTRPPSTPRGEVNQSENSTVSFWTDSFPRYPTLNITLYMVYFSRILKSKLPRVPTTRVFRNLQNLVEIDYKFNSLVSKASGVSILGKSSFDRGTRTWNSSCVAHNGTRPSINRSKEGEEEGGGGGIVKSGWLFGPSRRYKK